MKALANQCSMRLIFVLLWDIWPCYYVHCLKNLFFLLCWSIVFRYVDPKQIDCQLFLQQSWVYLGLAESCNLGSGTMESHGQVLAQQGQENTLIGRKKAPWLFTGWVPARKEEDCFFFLLCFYHPRAWELPLPGLPTLFNWGFCLIHFYRS